VIKRTFFLLLCVSALSLYAQETSTDLLESDVDSLFEEIVEDDTTQSDDTTAETNPAEAEEQTSLLEDLSQKKGYTFNASYSFVAGLAPGWSESPWYWDTKEEEFSNVVGIAMTSGFSLDFQLSPYLRAYQAFALDFPGYDLAVNQFWAEYNMQDLAYLKFGLQTVKWGISSNYSYTNLPSRIPKNLGGGDAYILKTDIPIGIGGLQFLALARAGFVEGADIENLTADDLAYGIKYNLATEAVDLNFATFYHKEMEPRAMFSAKSTLVNNTELYVEGLVALKDRSIGNPLFSGSIGVFNDFFDKKLSINVEYFYNGELHTYFEEDNNKMEEESPFVYGHNTALNLFYKPISGSTLRLFSSCLYNYTENTGKFILGLRATPFKDMNVYLAVPMVFGSADGTYYSSNYDEDNRPFSITLAVTFSGNFKHAQYK